jgi:hypothetical protein
MAKTTHLAPGQLRALGGLKHAAGFDRFYLAGASAIAFHLGHRRSEDLDFFSKTERVSLERIKRAATALKGARIIRETEACVELELNRIPIDFVRYPHPPLDPLEIGPLGVPVASLRDLAAMKLAAIARRGIKRDFWDLYAIHGAGVELREAADVYKRRFGRTESDLYHVQRALTWFEDAERDPRSPQGLTPARWAKIKRHFLAQAPLLLGREARDVRVPSGRRRAARCDGDGP